MPERPVEPPFDSLHVLRIDPEHALGCFVCGDHINPILQMTAWGNDLGKWSMGHAKCLWTREGFMNQGREAPDAE
jgi:hypothetical protein